MKAAAAWFWVGLAVAGAQVRQGGVYQLQSESLDSGGGPSSGGPYSTVQALPAFGGPATGGVYAAWSGIAASWNSGGNGSGPAAFLAWQSVFFGGPAEPESGPADDPDRDGIPNLLEFAFNLLPDSPATPLALNGASSGLPWVQEEDLGGSRYLTLQFIRRKNAGLFLPELSSSLTSWTPAASLILTGPVSVSGAYERVRLRLGSPLQPGEKVFYRLRVQIQ